MDLDLLESLTIKEIFELEETTYHQGCKWDYEHDSIEDDEFYDDDEDENEYEPVIRLKWLEKGDVNYETLYIDEDDDRVIKGNYVIFLDKLSQEIIIFDSEFLCDGVVENFFTFEDYDIVLTRKRK